MLRSQEVGLFGSVAAGRRALASVQGGVASAASRRELRSLTTAGAAAASRQLLETTTTFTEADVQALMCGLPVLTKSWPRPSACCSGCRQCLHWLSCCPLAGAATCTFLY